MDCWAGSTWVSLHDAQSSFLYGKRYPVLTDGVLWEPDVSRGSDGRQRTGPAGHSVLWVHGGHQLRRPGAQHPSHRTSLFPSPRELRPSHPGHFPSQQFQETGQTGRSKHIALHYTLIIKFYKRELLTKTWPSYSSANFSPRRPGLNSRTNYVSDVLNKVALGQVFSGSLLFSCQSSLHTHQSSFSWSVANEKGPFEATMQRHSVSPT
jgi:hypothetical protein